MKAGAPKKEPNRITAGGFSFRLSEDWSPAIVKDLSQRSAFIRVAAARPPKDLNAEQDYAGESDDDLEQNSADETDEAGRPDRGYFVDVKTLAAALTSESHSLESLSELLEGPDPRKRHPRSTAAH